MLAIIPLLAAALAQDELVQRAPRQPLPAVSAAAVRAAANDNRRPAGERRGDTLVVRLDVVEAAWQPEGADDPAVPVLAFTEPGRAPLVPGPLIRGRTGTPVRLVLRSRVDSALVVGGLRPSAGLAPDTVQLPARGTREVRFSLGAPGAHFYWAALPGLAFADRDWIDSQLTGALVVDPAAGAPPDRVWVVTEWFRPSRNGAPITSALVFNGRGWPHTERITLTQGDSARWRIINAAALEHPMHLHGFYYRVVERAAHGAPARPVPRERQALLNTDVMEIGESMTLEFAATTPGNWVFHCHFATHVNDVVSLAAAHPGAPHAHAAGPSSAPAHQMRGLVLGLHVLPRSAGAPVATGEPQRVRLLAQARKHRLQGAQTAYGFVVQAQGEPAPDSVQLPGPVLELTRGRPARITVVNNLAEPTGVHWHGLEIESFPDGVPGWSGRPGRVMAPIAPRDSFVAEFTPPRAGTFLYHSHLHELRQIGSGMYGALLVLDRPRDRTRDHLVIVGGGGLPVFHGIESPFALVNGRLRPVPLRLAAGVEHRLRLVSIHPEWLVDFALVSDSGAGRWRALAKDGADLPSALAVEGPARIRMGPGETADFAFTPGAPGRWRFEIRSATAGFFVPLDVVVTAPAGPAPAGDR